jgi:hypothetical protein
MPLPNHDIAIIVLHIIDAVQDRHPDRKPAKVVIQHSSRFSTPAAAWILEIAHEFPLFRIDTDDRPTVLQVTSPLAGQIAELPISLGIMRPGQAFTIRPQRETALVQETGDRAVADPKPQSP